jgi:hypothetical protein
MSSSTKKREGILKDLNELVGANLSRDNVGMLSKLSEGFYREVKRAKECASHRDAAGAEVHRLVAEYLHETSMTFEAIRE